MYNAHNYVHWNNTKFVCLDFSKLDTRFRPRYLIGAAWYVGSGFS
jgi:hypothetical protein